MAKRKGLTAVAMPRIGAGLGGGNWRIIEAMIEETDPATIAEVIGQCQRDADARDYFTGRAAAELPKPDPFPDDRRTCRQCSNLTYSGVCSVACPGGVVSAIRGYRPVADRLQRCDAFNERTL